MQAPRMNRGSFPVSTHLPSGCSFDLFLATHPAVPSEGLGGTAWRGKVWVAWVSLQMSTFLLRVRKPRPRESRDLVRLASGRRSRDWNQVL